MNSYCSSSSVTGLIDPCFVPNFGTGVGETSQLPFWSLYGFVFMRLKRVSENGIEFVGYSIEFCVFCMRLLQ